VDKVNFNWQPTSLIRPSYKTKVLKDGSEYSAEATLYLSTIIPDEVGVIVYDAERRPINQASRRIDPNVVGIREIDAVLLGWGYGPAVEALWTSFVTFVSPSGAIKVEFHPYIEYPPDVPTAKYRVVIKIGDKIAARAWCYDTELTTETSEWYVKRHEHEIRRVAGTEE
jgi:hypothetical protein